MTSRLSVLDTLDLEGLDWSDSGQVKLLVLALIGELQDTRQELQEMRAELERVKRKLAFYENPHTPPSRRMPRKKTREGSPKKRGAPQGHRGGGRSRPVDSEIIVVPADECENCGSRNLKCLRKKEKTVENLPEVSAPEATTFIRDKVECQDCGHVFTAKHPDCPIIGRLGVRLLVWLVMLRFLPRSVLRRGVEFLEHTHHLKISAPTANAALTRVAAAAEPQYRQLKDRLRAARVVYADETGFKVLGKKWWLWVFRTPDSIVVVLRDSRGGQVVEELLGLDFADIVVRDGWQAYKTLKHALVQRCWAHLLREAKEYNNTIPGKHLYTKLCQLFQEIKDFNDLNPSDSQRKQTYLEFHQHLQKLLEHYRRYPHLQKIITYAQNGGSQWFTCVLIAGVEPTNNLAEQAIREHALIRKIIGTFRSIHGAQVYETLASLIQTWRLRGDNIHQKLTDLITQNLCQTKN